MLRSLFLSSISLALVASCGDDQCGPGDAPDDGLVASSADVTLRFGNIFSGQNNDCPDAAAPPGVISLTLEGEHLDSPGLLTFCIPRPDQLAKQPAQLGSEQARIIDLNGEVGGCRYTFDASRPVTGTLTASGLCDAGANKAGYAIVVDGALSIKLAAQQPATCTRTSHDVDVTFSGTSRITAR
jgi:hypothetical protein